MTRKEGLVLFSLLVIIHSNSVPKYIHICNRNDPKLANCLTNSIEALVPKLKIGIPEINVPPVEPLTLEPVTIESSSGSTQFKVNLTDISIRGGSDFKILQLKPKVAKNYYRFKVQHPKIYIEGNYKINAKILLLVLKGNGKFHLNITNLDYDGILKGNIVSVEGVKYIKFEEMEIKIGFGQGKILLENLFNGDPVFGKAANDAINENIELFFEELRPNFEAAISNRFTEIANRIAGKFNYDEVFPSGT